MFTKHSDLQLDPLFCVAIDSSINNYDDTKTTLKN